MPEMPRVIFVNSWAKSVLSSGYFPYPHNYSFQMQNLNIPVLTFKAPCVYVCKPFYNSSHCYYLNGTTLNCLLSQKVYVSNSVLLFTSNTHFEFRIQHLFYFCSWFQKITKYIAIVSQATGWQLKRG